MQTLPGESELEATERILFECYAEFGVEVGDLQPDGGRPLRAASGEILQEAVDVCEGRLEEAGLAGDFPLTDEELLENYDRISLEYECARDLGLDIDEMISLDEWRASGGHSEIYSWLISVRDSLSQSEWTALQTTCLNP